MAKHVGHVIFFVLGAGLGIWWGVNHPQNAQVVARIEQHQVDSAAAAVTQAKQIIQKAVTTQPSP